MQFYAHITDKDKSGFTYLQYVHNKTRLWVMISVKQKWSDPTLKQLVVKVSTYLPGHGLFTICPFNLHIPNLLLKNTCNFILFLHIFYFNELYGRVERWNVSRECHGETV